MVLLFSQVTDQEGHEEDTDSVDIPLGGVWVWRRGDPGIVSPLPSPNKRRISQTVEHENTGTTLGFPSFLQVIVSM
jgi:hypothetical protein